MGQLLRIDNNQVFETFTSKVTNSDGSVSFLSSNGQYIGQAPGQYGVVNYNAEAKQYQRATQVSAALVVFQPEPSFPPAMYVLVEGKVYPA